MHILLRLNQSAMLSLKRSNLQVRATLITPCSTRCTVSCLFLFLHLFSTFYFLLIHLAIAVIHFCNACESFRHLNGKEVEKENAWPQSKNAISALQKYAQIFNFPNWIINCRNNLAHSSSRPPTLNFLHMAVTFALECMDRYFLSPLLLDACRVDPDYSVNGEKSKSANGFCSQCKWQSLSTMPPMKMQRPHLLENPSQSCSNQDVEKNTQGQKRRLNRSPTPIHSKRQKNSRFYN